MRWSLGPAFISSVAIHVGALIALSLAWGWLHVLAPARGLDGTDLVVVTPLVPPPVVPEEPGDRTPSPIITEEPTPLPAMIKAYITEQGRVEQVQVEQSAGHADLDASAVEAVGRWRFQPARRGRQAVATWVSIPVRFELNR
jgi:TonB family protein